MCALRLSCMLFLLLAASLTAACGDATADASPQQGWHTGESGSATLRMRLHYRPRRRAAPDTYGNTCIVALNADQVTYARILDVTRLDPERAACLGLQREVWRYTYEPLGAPPTNSPTRETGTFFSTVLREDLRRDQSVVLGLRTIQREEGQHLFVESYLFAEQDPARFDEPQYEGALGGDPLTLPGTLEQLQERAAATIEDFATTCALDWYKVIDDDEFAAQHLMEPRCE